METKFDPEKKQTFFKLKEQLDHHKVLDMQKATSGREDCFAKGFIIDLRDVNYVTSKGLSSLVGWVGELQGNGTKFMVKGASHYVKEAFEESGISGKFSWLEEDS